MKNSKARAALLAVALFLVTSLNAYAADNTSEATEGSNRMTRRIGAYVGLLGDPFPTIVGLNVAYNIFDFMRATVGLGQVSVSAGDSSVSATTIGGGLRFFVPNWSISPVAGLSFANVSVSKTGTDLGDLDIHGLNSSTSLFYANVGVDWQAGSGFNIGAGYNLAFMSGVGGAPYLNLGWFFGFI